MAAIDCAGMSMASSPDPGYAELQVTANFSFLRGASHPAELVLTAAVLGHRAIAVTDRNSFAGTCAPIRRQKRSASVSSSAAASISTTARVCSLFRKTGLLTAG